MNAQWASIASPGQMALHPMVVLMLACPAMTRAMCGGRPPGPEAGWHTPARLGAPEGAGAVYSAGAGKGGHTPVVSTPSA